jgi:hypothetical protein
VLIATPALTKEDLRDAPAMAARYAQMLRYTILANVVKETRGGKERYRLQTVALGFAVDIGGKQTIIDSDNTLGASLGLFGPTILAENEKILAKDIRQVARTDNMLVFDGQSVLRRGDEHRKMVIRHISLVSPETGRLWDCVLLLSKDRPDRYEAAEDAIQLLPPAMREQRLLSVKRDNFVLGMPTPEAFALRRIPQGKPIAYSPELREAATVKAPNREQVLRLEAELRAAVQRAER